MPPTPGNVVPFRKPSAPWKPPRWLKPWLWQTVVGWVIVANIAIYLAMVVVARGNGLLTSFPGAVTDWFGVLHPLKIRYEPWRLITAAFLHANLLHVLFNLLIFGYVGPRAEAAFGRGRFAALYLGAALSGTLVSWGWHTLYPATSLGASGAVAGMIAALFALAYKASGWNSPTTKQYLYWSLGMIIVGILLSRGSGVDNAAHIGGWIGGAGISWLFAGRRPWKPRIERAVLVVGSLVVVGSLARALTAGSIDVGPLVPKDVLEVQERMRAQEWAEAEAAAQTAIDAHRGDAYETILRIARAEALLTLGEKDAAKTELLAAERSRPSADENAGMALLWEQLGDLEKARLLAYRAKLANRLYAPLHERLKAGGSATPEASPASEE